MFGLLILGLELAGGMVKCDHGSTAGRGLEFRDFATDIWDRVGLLGPYIGTVEKFQGFTWGVIGFLQSLKILFQERKIQCKRNMEHEMETGVM